MKRRAKTLTRRRWLRGAGAAAAALPFLRAFPAAGQVALPKLVFFASPSGFLVGPDDRDGIEGWLPGALQGGTTHAEAPAPTTLPEIFRPLEAHRDDLLFLSGIRGVPTVGAHQQTVSMLTGAGVFNNEPARSAGGDGDFTADGVSVDQYVGERLGSRVLALAYKIDGFQLGEGRISYLGPDRPVTPIQSAVDAFERVSGTGDPSDPAVTERVLRRRSVLDRVRGDLARLRREAPAADRRRLDEHAESVRALEADLMAPALTCPDGSCAIGAYDPRDARHIPRLMRDYSCTLAHAMSCGYARVGFLQVGNLEGGHRPQWPELGCESSYRDHAIAHKFEGESGAGSDGLSQGDARRLGVSLQVAYNTMFADLLTRLKNTTDVDGSPMLDNTLVVHAKPMGKNHNRHQLMWVVAGGRNLGVRGGRFIRYANDDGPYVNDLHTSLCQRMGLADVTSFGRASLNRAPLALG